MKWALLLTTSPMTRRESIPCSPEDSGVRETAKVKVHLYFTYIEVVLEVAFVMRAP